MNKIRRLFEKNGFVLIRGALSQKETYLLRNHIRAKFKSKDANDLISVSRSFEDPKIYNNLLNKKLIEVSQKIIGKNLFINELEVQYNSFPPSKSTPFHYDGQSQRYQNEFKSEKYKALKLGIYLQNSNEKYAGSIKIVPKSHKIFPLLNKFQRFENISKKILSKFLTKEIEVIAGDAILFDHKLLHQGMWPSIFNSQIKPEQSKINQMMKNNEKIVIYWNVFNKFASESFLKNSYNRAINQELLSNHHSFNYFTDYLKMSYPSDYKKNLCLKLKNRNISISTLKNRELKLIKFISKNSI